MSEDRDLKMKSLDIALEQIQKEHGKGAIMKLGDKPIQKIAAISTGSISSMQHSESAVYPEAE